MPLDVIVNGATKDAESAKVTVGNAQKRVTRIDAWNESAWKLVQSFAPPMSLSVTPSVSGSEELAAPIVVTSSPATATPSGGTAPYTYLWARVSGSVLTVTSPTNASTTFSASIDPGDTKFATYRCTATDKNGITAQGEVSVSLFNTSEA